MAKVVVLSRYDGRFNRSCTQEATPRKPMQTERKFYGNGWTSQRLVAAIQSSNTLSEAARRIGGSDLFLLHLKRWTDRRAA